MSVESWAQKVIQDELQESVVVHDDNSQPSMQDLRIGPADSPAIAIECVGAVDSVRTETGKLGPGRGSLTLALHRDWTGILKPKATIKDLAPRLQAILQGCEREGVPSAVPVDWRSNQSNPRLFSALDSDGITFISWFRVSGKGKVYLTMDGIGGAVDSEGHDIPGWITAFLSDPKQADVISKLARSGAPVCHALVILDYAGAPWSVQSYLDGELVVLPPAAPRPPSRPEPREG